MIVVGLLLAGGRSSRFGSEKAVFELQSGLAMMDAPLNALRSACVRVAVSARVGGGAETRARRLDLPILVDDPAHPEGPLAGILAGLEWAAAVGADWLVTAPCDAPTVKDRLVKDLIAEVIKGAPAAVAVSGSNWEPLLAAWPVRTARLHLTTLLHQGTHPSVKTVLAELGALPVTGHDGVNVNRPSDLTSLT